MLPILVAVVLNRSLHLDSKIIAPGATLQKLAGGFAFTEGPVPDKQGNVYFTDQPNNRILKWSIDGKVETWMEPSGRANGMCFDHKGNLIACADNKNELWSITPDFKVTVLVDNFQGKLLNGPNDVWVRPDGGMYITDPLYVRPYWTRDPKPQQTVNHVFYLPPGSHVMTSVIDDLNTPNGIVGTPNGRALFIGDLGLNATYRYLIRKDGTLSDKTLFCHLGSDGMTMDQDGNIYCSGKGVTVFDPTGVQIEHIDVPEDWVGHVCFGGKDHKLLFITATHGIYGLQMRVRCAY